MRQFPFLRIGVVQFLVTEMQGTVTLDNRVYGLQLFGVVRDPYVGTASQMRGKKFNLKRFTQKSARNFKADHLGPPRNTIYAYMQYTQVRTCSIYKWTRAEIVLDK